MGSFENIHLPEALLVIFIGIVFVTAGLLSDYIVIVPLPVFLAVTKPTLLTVASVAGSTMYFNTLLSALFGTTSVDIVSVSLSVKSKLISVVRTFISVTCVTLPVVSTTCTVNSAVTFD